jgi:ketosteroid isomerase-like protein
MSAQTIEQELTQFKEQFYDATKRKDRDTLETMVHDGFIFLDPEGRIVDKEICLSSITHPDSHFADNFKRVEKEVAVSADGKTVTEVADVELTGDLKGENRSGLYINTATYVKGPDGWQVIGNTWQEGQSCPGCCGSMSVKRKCAVCGRDGSDGLLAAHLHL